LTTTSNATLITSALSTCPNGSRAPAAHPAKLPTAWPEGTPAAASARPSTTRWLLAASPYLPSQTSEPTFAAAAAATLASARPASIPHPQRHLGPGDLSGASRLHTGRRILRVRP
jgi:hypothetical protein